MVNVYRLVPVSAFVCLWELVCRLNPELIFFFGLPSKILGHFVFKVSDGSLILHFAVTTFEAASGFLIGTLLGVVTGLSFWFSRTAFEIARPYVIALGAIPVFALAPILVVWFGIGIFSKIMIAAISTYFVALQQAYTGIASVDPMHVRVLKVMGASQGEVFRKAVIPTALVWVISASKLNVGLALLGAFIGEFISSERGLGHMILVASGLFDISLVLTGVLCLMLIALLFNILIERSETSMKRAIVRHL